MTNYLNADELAALEAALRADDMSAICRLMNANDRRDWISLGGGRPAYSPSRGAPVQS